MPLLRTDLIFGWRPLSLTQQVGNGVIVSLLHQSEKRRREQQRAVGRGEIEPAEHAGRQQVAAVGHKHILQQHISAYRSPHASRIPLAHERDAWGIAWHLQIQGAFDPWGIANQQCGGGKIVGGARQGHKEFAAIDDVAVIDLFRPRTKTASPDRKCGVRLAEFHRFAVRLSVEHATLNHFAEFLSPQCIVAGAYGLVQRMPVGHVAHHQHGQAVHIIGQRGRGVALGDLLGDETIGL